MNHQHGPRHPPRSSIGSRSRYYDDPERPQLYTGAGGGRALKTTKGPNPIILVPQPSDDPNDPLNWPIWKRDIITFILSLTAVFATALGPILAANTLTLSYNIGLDFTYIALLTGYFLLGVGVAGFIFVPSSRIWGKRHAFIIGTIILIATSAWAGSVGTNYTSLLWARIFQGVGCAPFESLVNAAVGDLYFVHERGPRMALTNLAVFGGAFFTPIVVGVITHTIYWWWTFYLVAIFCAVCLPLIIFFCPETAFRRDASLNLDIGTLGSTHDGVEKGPEGTTQGASPTPSSSGANRPRKTFAERLAPFDGRKTDESFWKLLFRPLPLFAQPAFLWAALIQGTLIGWTVFIGVILAAIFLGPPLFWDEVRTGYAYTGAFVGAVLGYIISGLLADSSAKWLTKRNGGIYEPEFRIVLVIPQLIFGCMGLYGFGASSAGVLEGRFHYVVPIVFFGFVVCGLVIGAVASSLYIVDAYRDLAVEGFTCLIIFKNILSFGLTFKAYDWLRDGDVTHIFIALGTVQVVVCLLSIPMCKHLLPAPS